MISQVILKLVQYSVDEIRSMVATALPAVHLEHYMFVAAVSNAAPRHGVYVSRVLLAGWLMGDPVGIPGFRVPGCTARGESGL